MFIYRHRDMNAQLLIIPGNFIQTEIQYQKCQQFTSVLHLKKILAESAKTWTMESMISTI